MISRRQLTLGALAAGPALWVGAAAARASDAQRHKAISALERRHGGRLGIAIVDTGTSKHVAFRGNERFALASTFKFLAAAFVLTRVDRKEDSLTRRVVYAKSDLVSYSPITEKHVGEGMTVGELCEAAVTLSDNTAGNLLLDSFGGPAGLTAWLRALGDKVTRLDRREPALNENRPGDPRDTTTPLAMLQTMQKLVLGTTLSAASRAQLVTWLVACKTGSQRLRAGVPQGWRVGDKTGGGGHNAANDIAFLWPPERAPIVVAAYYTGANASLADRNKVLADVGRLAAGV
jgi:beta-lactamase class A